MKLSKSIIFGSISLLLMFNIYNAINFLFHISMARMLSVVNYGILATLFSIVYISGMFSESIQLVITKYASKESNNGKLKNLLRKSISKSLRVSVLLFIFYLFLSFLLSYLLDIKYSLVVLTGLIIFTAFLSPTARGILQGRKMFNSLGLNMIIESSFKLLLAILLVFIGWEVYGAIIATILAVLISFLFSFVSLRKIISSKEQKAATHGIYSYTAPVFIVIFSTLIFYSLDVIIAKIVFEDAIAGYYAVASILAKTIFLGTQPISKAMFPLSVQTNEKKKRSSGIFFTSLLILTLVIVAALVIFYFFPEFLVKLFSGKSLIQSASILFYLGVAISILSVANLVSLYKISKGNLKNYCFLPISILIEIFLLSYFSGNLLQFSFALISASAIFLWVSVVLLQNETINNHTST